MERAQYRKWAVVVDVAYGLVVIYIESVELWLGEGGGGVLIRIRVRRWA